MVGVGLDEDFEATKKKTRQAPEKLELKNGIGQMKLPKLEVEEVFEATMQVKGKGKSLKKIEKREERNGK